jgi:hypothetical protein
VHRPPGGRGMFAIGLTHRPSCQIEAESAQRLHAFNPLPVNIAHGRPGCLGPLLLKAVGRLRGMRRPWGCNLRT